MPGTASNASAAAGGTICIPCAMPDIASRRYLPRGPGDRQAVVPAMTAQIDFVFAVECSIRAAQLEVTALRDIGAS
jgi:myosin-crossreactive antigen